MEDVDDTEASEKYYLGLQVILYCSNLLYACADVSVTVEWRLNRVGDLIVKHLSYKVLNLHCKEACIQSRALC